MKRKYATNHSEWGTSLRAAKARSELTYAYIRRTTGLSNNTINKILDGSEDVLLRHVVTLAECFGLVTRVVFDSEYQIETGG